MKRREISVKTWSHYNGCKKEVDMEKMIRQIIDSGFLKYGIDPLLSAMRLPPTGHESFSPMVTATRLPTEHG